MSDDVDELQCTQVRGIERWNPIKAVETRLYYKELLDENELGCLSPGVKVELFSLRCADRQPHYHYLIIIIRMDDA